MINSSRNSTQLKQGQLEMSFLEPEDFKQAREISDRVTAEPQQWRIYINSLAVFGFEQWLRKRVPEISINRDRCSLWQPNSANVIDAVCNLKVENFQVCLIVKEDLSDEVVMMPKTVLDSAELAAHFYVVIEVLEEEEQVIFQGFVRRNQLLDYPSRVDLGNRDGCYRFPRSLFDADLNHLLFDSRYLEPTAIPLPVEEPGKKTPWLQQAVNVALWLRDELDELAENLDWGQPSPLIPVTASGFRSIELFDPVLAELSKRGMEIPRQGNGSSRTIYLAGTALELLAGTWELPPESDASPTEWSLLLILGMKSGSVLPQGIRLQVEDLKEVIYDQAMETEDCYLMVRLVGNLDEQFTVTIELNEEKLRLEPLKFEPNQPGGTIQTNWPHF